MALSTKDAAAVRKAATAGGLSSSDGSRIVSAANRNQTINTRTGETRDLSSYNLPSLDKTINSTLLQPQQAIQLPKPMPIPNYTGTLAGIQATLTQNQTDQSENQRSADLFKSLTSLIPQQESVFQNKDVKKAQANVEAQKQQVANYTAQLNTITAKSQADQLAVTGQGRGIPEPIIGGQQAQIAKEAAIQALPIAAQLAAAQGNLDLAQQHLDTVFKIRSDEITNAYNYKLKVYDAVQNYVNQEENKRLRAMELAETRAYNEKNNMIQYAQSLSSAALSNGQPGLASRIMALDPNSPTYRQDVARMAGQFSVKGAGAAAPTIKTINGVDYQWNPSTGQWETITIGGAANSDQAQNTKDQLQFLRDTTKQAIENTREGIFRTPVGPSAFNRFLGENIFVGNTSYKQMEALTNTLRTNVLTLMTDPGVKKYFGPQMSEADVRLMTAAGTTLNPLQQTNTQLKTELQRLDSLFARMQKAVETGAAAEGGLGGGIYITAPDGTQVEIVD